MEVEESQSADKRHKSNNKYKIWLCNGINRWNLTNGKSNAKNKMFESKISELKCKKVRVNMTI